MTVLHQYYATGARHAENHALYQEHLAPVRDSVCLAPFQPLYVALLKSLAPHTERLSLTLDLPRLGCRSSTFVLVQRWEPVSALTTCPDN